MKLVGSGQQAIQHLKYDASSTLTTGNTAQLVLARSVSRSYLEIQNLSAASLVFEFGSARATAAITSGAVSSITVTNAGFNFTKPPLVRFLGGGNQLGGASAANSSYLGLNQPNGSSPSHPAVAHAVLTGGAVSSIVIDDPGAGYAIAPAVVLYNSDLDPYGCALPAVTPTPGNLFLAASSPPYILNGTCCTTDSISVIGSTTGQVFTCRWMD